MSERKMRLAQAKSKQGTDCYTFDVVFQGELKNLPKQPLINTSGKKYGTVEARDGKVHPIRLLFLVDMIPKERNWLRQPLTRQTRP